MRVSQYYNDVNGQSDVHQVCEEVVRDAQSSQELYMGAGIHAKPTNINLLQYTNIIVPLSGSSLRQHTSPANT